MSKMICVAPGFQYSVNIGYDLNNDEKIRNFIPTKSALKLLEEVLASTSPTSTDRARVLVGAYGKGKSHIVLMILSMLMKRDIALFEKIMPYIHNNPKLFHLIRNYYESDNKIMPIAINGSNTSLTQAFLLALKRTLSDNNMLDVMPDTNYRAAVSVINRWKSEYPDTYERFIHLIDEPIIKFIERLEHYDVTAYETFERIYPKLTAGSVFNPFLGFDVVELYENVAKSLRVKGYTGIYVVYDEFSKYLEANIANASVSDTKMLQDFAEKCSRSGELQMHLMLISHKEISNYIDKLPKQKVDGWRGVSERFNHIHLNNNFSQTYEVIASVIQKQQQQWDIFCEKHQSEFLELKHRYQKHPIFMDAIDMIDTAFYGCYPLQPVSTFILPRLSERVAQNERTLFTFLSSDGTCTLPTFLNNHDDTAFKLLTPDLIYDYFEPLFKKEAFSTNIHNYYVLTTSILNQLPEDSLGSKIVKTISLIYILEQFERLKPSKEEIIGIYSTSYKVNDIENAITDLIEKEFVIYLKRSNDYLQLKKTSGVDIKKKINDLVELQQGRINVKDTLNESNFNNYMYPSRYNDEYEMTRFFSFEFIAGEEVTEDIDWNIKSEKINADGVIYGIIPENEESISNLVDLVAKTSLGLERFIFVIPKHFSEIEAIVREYKAVSVLRDMAFDDQVLFDEYEVIFEDLHELIQAFMDQYTHPEEYKSIYIHNGAKITIRRKAELTELMSNICDNVYSMTPIINNEALNRNEITNVSNNSRRKIIAALLRNELEHNLGLSGTTQEVSIMRSTLIRTGVLVENAGTPAINLRPSDERMSNMISTIEAFILDARRNGKVCFSDLYIKLMSAEYHIGLRLGLIPVYLAAVLHEYKQQVFITDKYGQVPINSDVLLQINSDPNSFYLSYLDWNKEKEDYINRLSDLFSEYVIEAEKAANSYDYVSNAIRRWFMALPKYSKDSTQKPDGTKIPKRYVDTIQAMKSSISGFELLFKRLPYIFEYTEVTADLAEDISNVKICYDQLLEQLKKELIAEVKETFLLNKNNNVAKRMTLTSTIKEWCESLDDSVFEQLFSDGTEKCLSLFKSITNDENIFIYRLAKLATDLRMEDWDNNTRAVFSRRISMYKSTAEAFHGHKVKQESLDVYSYQITYSDENGETITKRFEKVDISKRGKLLYNQITSAVESMGQSISEQEKRQILIEVIKKLC